MRTEREKKSKPKEAGKKIDRLEIPEQEVMYTGRCIVRRDRIKVYVPDSFAELKNTFTLPDAIYPLFDSEDSVTILRDIWQVDCYNMEQAHYAIFLCKDNGLLAWRKVGMGAYGFSIPNPYVIASLAKIIGAKNVIVGTNVQSVSKELANSDYGFISAISIELEKIGCKLVDYIKTDGVAHVNMHYSRGKTTVY
jgi:hypothetical protein